MNKKIAFKLCATRYQQQLEYPVGIFFVGCTRPELFGLMLERIYIFYW